MADNTKQFRWIMVIHYNLEWIFAQDPQVFVAGDLLWYPVEGDNKIRQAPDTLVVFGRPKGDRGSYQQWKEGHIAPQVVFEILSPGNTPLEMKRKQAFYNRYGVEEYYSYDPDRNHLLGWLRPSDRPQGESIQNHGTPGNGTGTQGNGTQGNGTPDLVPIPTMADWVSPRLGIRFCWEATDLGDSLQLLRPDGTPFATYTAICDRLESTLEELDQQRQRTAQAAQEVQQERQRAEQERQRAEQESQRAEQERQRAEQESQRAEQERQRADRLAQQLKALGLDPDAL